MLFPLSPTQEKLLQLLHFQGRLNLLRWPVIRPKTMLPYEKWFLNEYRAYFTSLGVTTAERCLRELGSYGLVEEDSRSNFRLTSNGSKLAYILAEYTKQVTLRDLSGFIDVDKLFDGMPNRLGLLDVGCGGGASLAAINRYMCGEKHPTLIGLDREYQNLSFGKKIINSVFANGETSPRISFIQADAHGLPFRNDSFHIVYIRGTFHLINREFFLAEACRVLRPKGRLLIIIPSYKYFIKFFFDSLRARRISNSALAFFSILNGLRLRSTGKQWRIKSTWSYGDTARSLMAALRKSGFLVLRCDYRKGPFSVSPIVAIAEKRC